MKLYLSGFIACLALPLLADTAPLPLGAGVRTADPSAHVWPDGQLWLYTLIP